MAAVNFKSWHGALLALLLQAVPAFANTAPASATEAAAVPVQAKSDSTADHSKFKELQKDFKSGPEVTRACLTCHTEAARQVQKTKHWTWEFLNPQSGQRLGKKNIINNFCTAVPSNYEFCTACHVGYGWKDDKFDFSAQENVDCLVCHESTGTYRKLPGLSGHPAYRDTEYPPGSGKIVKAPDLRAVAQSVGKSSRKNCGACHFYGGGGDAVKHGDIDSSLIAPKRYLDVHMEKDGLNFTCATCHKTSGHEIPGSRYTPMAVDQHPEEHMRGKEDKNPASCQACHKSEPHKNPRLNMHTAKIACQTCHVPEFARGGKPTKMLWDWSTAGKLDENNKPFTKQNSAGHVSYDTRKGDFIYEANVIPEYAWLNGEVTYTLRETKLDPGKVVKINQFGGSAEDGRSKIWPLKVFHGKQPYDSVSNQLVVFHTFGKDDSAFWTNFNWDKAMEFGMKSIGAEYSGKYGFVETEMSWPIAHMVAPKEDALGCAQCHAPAMGVGRLDKVPGVYIPGRHASVWLDRLGWWLAALSLLGVMVHGGLRVFLARKGAGK